MIFCSERFADAFDFAEPIFGDEFGQRLAQTFEGARGVGVGAGLERIFALEFEQRADLRQESPRPFLCPCAEIQIFFFRGFFKNKETLPPLIIASVFQATSRI